METAGLERGVEAMGVHMMFRQPGWQEEFSGDFFEEQQLQDEDAAGMKRAKEAESSEKTAERDIVKEIADLVDRRFLGKKAGEAKAKKKIPSKPNEGNAQYMQDPGEELHQNYERIDELFSYLGHLKTATNIYREHFIEHGQKKKEEETVYKQEKPQDLDFNEFESIIKIKKMNDIMSGGRNGGVIANSNPITGGYFGFEIIGATMQEKWAFLSLFTYNKVLAMIRYTFSLT